MNNRGVLYAVTSSGVYLEAALMSALALRSLEPDLPICILSDSPLLSNLALEQHQITPLYVGQLAVGGPFASRWLKTNLGRLTPYSETLFLDADILPLQPITPLWDYLAEAPWAMARDRLPTLALCDHVAEAEKQYTLEQWPPQTPHFNSGVLLWRDQEATQQLFKVWFAEWQRFQNQDQLALLRALQLTDLAMATLPSSYNISPRDALPLQAQGKTIHLLHCWGGQVSSGAFHRLMAHYYPAVPPLAAQLLYRQPSFAPKGR